MWLLAADVVAPPAAEMPLLDLSLLPPWFAPRVEVDLDEATEAEAPILVDRPAATPTPAPIGSTGFDLVWLSGGSFLMVGDGSLLVVPLAVAGLVLRPGDAATLAREEEVGLWRCFIPGSSLSNDGAESNAAGDSPRLLLPCF